jgi:hypothetical protein
VSLYDEDQERLRSDEAPTPVGSSSSGIKSHRSLNGLDRSSDSTQKIIEWAVGAGVVLLLLGVLVGWFGGFMYFLHVVFGS